MITITVEQMGVSPQEFVTNFYKDQWWEVQERFFEMGREAHRYMRETIVRKIQRVGSTGNLVRAVTFEFGTQGYNAWFGIGKLDILNQQSPYWHWQNYGIAMSGRRIPPSTTEFPRLRGHFEPDVKGRFVKGKPRFSIYPTKALTPMNYIQETATHLTDKFTKFSRRRTI